MKWTTSYASGVRRQGPGDAERQLVAGPSRSSSGPARRREGSPWRCRGRRTTIARCWRGGQRPGPQAGEQRVDSVAAPAAAGARRNAPRSRRRRSSRARTVPIRPGQEPASAARTSAGPRYPRFDRWYRSETVRGARRAARVSATYSSRRSSSRRCRDRRSTCPRGSCRRPRGSRARRPTLPPFGRMDRRQDHVVLVQERGGPARSDVEHGRVEREVGDEPRARAREPGRELLELLEIAGEARAGRSDGGAEARGTDGPVRPARPARAPRPPGPRTSPADPSELARAGAGTAIACSRNRRHRVARRGHADRGHHASRPRRPHAGRAAARTRNQHTSSRGFSDDPQRPRARP